ncbi:MAG: SpoIID/LytB domain-containing protein [Defluviitaleaceae bacterium]|nr:SpoIID/LytB domain-containing protein [Defluviitaleaceae bacterium]
MKSIFLFLILLIFVSACGHNDDNIGGRLPMVVTEWASDTDGDVLGWFIQNNYTDNNSYTPTEVDIARIGDDFPVPRAMVAKMLSLAHTCQQTIDSWARYPSIIFTDVNLQSWYFKYVNAAYTLNQMSGGGTMFRPLDMLTLHEAGLLMLSLNPGGPGLLVTDENRNLPISYALWVDLFIHYIANIDEAGVIVTTQVVPVAHSTVTEQIITNNGTFSSMGINMSVYLDREVEILHRDGEILALLGQVTAMPTLHNVLLQNIDTFGITAFIGGAVRNYVFDEGVAQPPEGTIIADITIHGNTVLSITPAETILRGTLEQVGPQSIVLREWGAIPIRSGFAVYLVANGNITEKNTADLIVGANMADFHLTGGAIGAAIITSKPTPVNIRVLIGTSNFAGLIHNYVSITATGQFTVCDGKDEIIKTLAQGEAFPVPSGLMGHNRLYIRPVNPQDRLEIIGLTRNHPTPLYRGALEIAQYGDGFIIVNELPLEEYLYAVVPSEMPSYFGLQAAKVQAITARTFAVNQFYENRFRTFGAHVDDSVISQVYNNIPENDISREAVRATAGLVMTYNGEIIRANYFSTSGGVTANAGEVWAAGSSFPAYTPAFLTSRLQFDPNDIVDPVLRSATKDLSREQNAALFFTATNIPAYERYLPWFRWQVRMTVDELTQSINATLPARQQASPHMIHSLDATGATTGMSTGNIGQVTALEVTQRGAGGNVMELLITGTNGQVRVQTEFNIRSILSPHAATITRENGSPVSGLNLMPSGFFTIQKETGTNGALASVIFHGGGHGHGAGMSQNGANIMLNQGYSYRDVLKHFYPGVEIDTNLK